MDNALWTLLTTTSAVTAICGQRIYWGVIPQGAASPAMTLNIISGSDAPHLRGTDGLWVYRVQVDCYAANRPEARALSGAVVGALNGYRAASPGIAGVFVDATRETFEAAASGRPSRISHDFNIFWRG
jgi:hypothetical protein